MATFSKDLSVTSSGVYTLEMNLIPTGSTVTPVNDIQTWLHCANIWNKNYTTLAQVLADTSTLNSLIQSNNAADYMARSTDWAANPGLVPKMTSNTTPSGQCFVSDYSSSGGNDRTNVYKAFDGNDSTGWSSYDVASGTNYKSRVGYMFTNATVIRKIYAKKYSNVANTPWPSSASVVASNDGTNWTTITTKDTSSASSDVTFTMPSNNTAYKYWALYMGFKEYSGGWGDCNFYTIQMYKYEKSITEDQTAMTYIGANAYCANKLLANATWCTAICNSTYFEKVLTTKVPTMTSNTAPSGQAFASHEYENYALAYKAFDGNDSTSWESGTTSFPEWVGYKFTTPVRIAKAIIVKANRPTQVKVQGSNDNLTWTDLSEIQTYSETASEFVYNKNILCMKSTNKFQYIRLAIIATASNYDPLIYTLQFYGHV